MKLNITERVRLLELLRDSFQKGSYSGMKEVRRTLALLMFREEEQQEFEMKEIDGKLTYNNKAQNHYVDVPIGTWMHEEIRGELLRLDREEQLTQELLGLFERFVVDYTTL